MALYSPHRTAYRSIRKYRFLLLRRLLADRLSSAVAHDGEFVIRRRPNVPTAPSCTELSPNFGDGRGRSGGGGCGLTVGRLGDDLDPVFECHTENKFWQLVMTVETAPAFLRALDQFEDHRERGPIR